MSSELMETAKRLRLLTTDPEDPFGFPRVANEDAKELFQQLCQRLSLQLRSSASSVASLMRLVRSDVELSIQRLLRD